MRYFRGVWPEKELFCIQEYRLLSAEVGCEMIDDF